MPEVALQWLTSSAPAAPLWTVGVPTTQAATRAVVALAGFSVSFAKNGTPTSSQLLALEVRAIIHQMSSSPGSTGALTWVAIEVITRLSSGGATDISLGDFQVALLVVDPVGESAASVGVASALGSSSSPVSLDDLPVTSATPMLAGFGATYQDERHKISTLEVSGVSAMLTSTEQGQTVTVDGDVTLSDSSNHVGAGSVDVSYLALGSGSSVQTSLVTATLSQLQSNAQQSASFGSVTVTSAVVAIRTFDFGFSSALGDQEIETVAIQVSTPTFSGATVSFSAQASLGASVAPDTMQVTFLVIAVVSASGGAS